MVLVKMKSLIANLQEELQRFWKEINYKFHHIAESNEELCYYYIFNKNYSDLRFRLKFLRKFYPNYTGFRFFQAFDMMINGMEGDAKDEFKYVAKAIPNHPFASYYADALSGEFQDNIPENIIKAHFDLVAPFYTQLDKTEREAYIIQVMHNHNLFKFEQDQVSVLDIGCGNGYTTKRIYQFLGKMPVIRGIDISEKMIEWAKQRKLSSGVDLYEETHLMDAKDYLSNHKDKHDIILCLSLINYINDLPGFFKEVENKLLTSGAMILGFEFDDRLESRAISKDYMKYTYSREYIKDLLKAANLRIVSEPIQASSGFCLNVVKKNS